MGVNRNSSRAESLLSLLCMLSRAEPRSEGAECRWSVPSLPCWCGGQITPQPTQTEHPTFCPVALSRTNFASSRRNPTRLALTSLLAR